MEDPAETMFVSMHEVAECLYKTEKLAWTAEENLRTIAVAAGRWEEFENGGLWLLDTIRNIRKSCSEIRAEVLKTVECIGATCVCSEAPAKEDD